MESRFRKSNGDGPRKKICDSEKMTVDSGRNGNMRDGGT